MLAAAAAAIVGTPVRGQGRAFVPTSQYESRMVQGWQVRVNRALAISDGGAVKLLDDKLVEIRRTVPEPAVEKLRKVPIWLGVDDGHAPCAEYHPSREWLEKNGYNPDKARGVEIGNAARFVAWSKDQPSMVLHELAHAYHHQVLGYEHEGIRTAYRKALESGSYAQVRRNNGRTEKAYALTNEQEYFAEATEAFFGRNDFYPFVRSELEKHDPEGARVLRQVWGLP